METLNFKTVQKGFVSCLPSRHCALTSLDADGKEAYEWSGSIDLLTDFFHNKGYKEKKCDKGDNAPAQVAQRDGGCSVPGDI